MERLTIKKKKINIEALKRYNKKIKNKNKEKINIKKEDIIEADFEEIDPDKSESKNSKQ